MTDPEPYPHDPSGPLLHAAASALAGAPPHEALAALEAVLAPVIDGLDVRLFDLQHRVLTSVRLLPGVDGGGAGSGEFIEDGSAVMVPVTRHGDVLGMVLGRPVDVAAPHEVRDLLERLAPVLGMWVTSWFTVSDLPRRARRLRPLSLAAEIQTDLLPPFGYADDQVSVSAAIEPAYDTGGDVFDYSVDESEVVVSVLDGMGHGLAAATVSSLAAAASRNARRSGGDLVAMAAAVDSAVRARHGDRYFVCAVFARVTLSDGACTWLTAGHVTPLVLGRDGIRELPMQPALPLGLRVVEGDTAERLQAQHTVLAAGETLVLASDGIYDNTVETDGTPLGRERVHAAIEQYARPLGPGSARRVVEQLLVSTGTVLRDDATLVFVHRRG